MATNLELLKALDEGMEIRITTGPDTYGEIVEYAPRRKGDRQPWVLRNGNVTFHFAADEVAAVAPVPAAEEVPFLQVQAAPAPVTPEMVEALQTLRSNVRSEEMSDRVAQALVILDNAGVFSAIDRAAPWYPQAPAEPGAELTTFTISNSAYHTLAGLGFDLTGATRSHPSPSWLIQTPRSTYVRMLAALRAAL